MTVENERISKAKLTATQDTTRFKAEIQQETTNLVLGNALANIQSELEQEVARKDIFLAQTANEQVAHSAEISRNKDKEEAAQVCRVAIEELRRGGVKVDSEALIAQFGALEGGFTEALTALSRDDVAVKIAEATSVQSMIGGKSAVDVITQILGGSERLKPFLGALTRGAERTQSNT